MKLCTFVPADGKNAPMEKGKSAPLERLGALSTRAPDLIIDLKAAARAYRKESKEHLGYDPEKAGFLDSMATLLDQGPPAMDALHGLLELVDKPDSSILHPVGSIKLLAPLPRPRSIRDCMAFERHYLQAMRGGARMKFPAAARLDALTRKCLGLSLIRVPGLFREIPAYYKGNPHTVVGPDAEIVWPGYSKKLDYELELAFYINKKGKDIDAKQALDHVGGFTIFNDFSARDAQIREMDLRLGPAKGKDFDTGNAMGPYLVTPDELGDLEALKATAKINGQVVSDSSTAAAAFSVEEIIAYISKSETLYPGDLIGLGTVPNGCGLEHGTWLKANDVIELEIEKLGILRNRVVKE